MLDFSVQIYPSLTLRLLPSDPISSDINPSILLTSHPIPFCPFPFHPFPSNPLPLALLSSTTLPSTPIPSLPIPPILLPSVCTVRQGSELYHHGIQVFLSIKSELMSIDRRFSGFNIEDNRVPTLLSSILNPLMTFTVHM